MKTSIRKWIVLFVLAGLGASLTACNTSRGFGEDLEEVGEEIQEEAN